MSQHTLAYYIKVLWHTVSLKLAISTVVRRRHLWPHQQDINRSPRAHVPTWNRQKQNDKLYQLRRVAKWSDSWPCTAARHSKAVLLLLHIDITAIKSDADISENGISADWRNRELIKMCHAQSQKKQKTEGLQVSPLTFLPSLSVVGLFVTLKLLRSRMSFIS